MSKLDVENEVEKENSLELKDIDQKFLDYVEEETKGQIQYMYDKVFRFFAIDLSIFPIVLAIFSLSLPTLNVWSIIISLIAFVIGILLKLYIITIKLYGYVTPPSLFDVDDDKEFYTENQRITEFFAHRYDKVKDLWKDFIDKDKFIRLVNQSIWYSACALICVMSNLIQYQLTILKINSVLIYWIILIINIIAFGLACSYQLLRKYKEKLKFWKKKEN